MATKSERLYIRTVDEMFGVQRYLERTGTDKQVARSLIQAVRSSPSQAQGVNFINDKFKKLVTSLSPAFTIIGTYKKAEIRFELSLSAFCL